MSGITEYAVKPGSRHLSHCTHYTRIVLAGSTKHNYGAYFPDLASNMLGSFVMGLLTASYAQDPESKAVLVLPDSHIWQVSPSYTVGSSKTPQ